MSQDDLAAIADQLFVSLQHTLKPEQRAILEQYHRVQEERVYTDHITGTKTYGWFKEEMPRMIANADRAKTPRNPSDAPHDPHQYDLSLCLVDVDNFKKLNDEYGHLIGDKILRAVGDYFTMNLRQGDAVVRRTGSAGASSDEFYAIMPMAPRTEARKVFSDLIAGFPEYLKSKNLPVATLSCGIATFDEDGHDTEMLEQVADARLRVAKMSGRNQAYAGKETEPRIYVLPSTTQQAG